MHFKPKKRLGQNFLTDRNIQRKIISCLELKDTDVVLEIGAGRGELTGWIAQRVRALYALEIDAGLCSGLEEMTKDLPNVKILQQDILKFDLAKRFKTKKNKSGAPRPSRGSLLEAKSHSADSIPGFAVEGGRTVDFAERIKIVGNIPYGISTPIIQYLFKHRQKIESVFLTVQKEFAARLAACPGSKAYSSLSCFAQYYCQPKILFTIKNNSFFPVPKVDSSFIKLIMRPDLSLGPGDEKRCFTIIRAAFNKRRKTLRNSLEGIVSSQALERFFSLYGMDRDVRPECLAFEDFANLAKII